METVTGGVTGGPHEGVVTVTMREDGGVDIEENLKEGAGHSDGVGLGTVSIIGGSDGVRHVTLVARAVKIHSIPAGGEPQLSAKTVFTGQLVGGKLVLLRVSESRKTLFRQFYSKFKFQISAGKIKDEKITKRS